LNYRALCNNYRYNFLFLFTINLNFTTFALFGRTYVGFTLAITAQNPFYRPVSEKDSQEGYVDLFLHPLLDIYKDISHSYIIELKYAKGKDSSERIEQLRRQAIEQAERYASSESVQKAIGPTMLHKIIIVYRGMEMVVCEEL